MHKPITECSNKDLLEMHGYAVSIIGGDDDQWDEIGYSLEQIVAECLRRMGDDV